MDNAEGDAAYPTNSYGVGNQHGHGSSQGQKIPDRDIVSSQTVENQYSDGGVDEEEEAADNAVKTIGKDSYGDGDGDDDDEDDDDDDDDDDQDDRRDGKAGADLGIQLHPKKRKLRTLTSSYELVPRLPAQSPPATAALPVATVRPSSGGRNTLADWTEHETFVLLDAWGDRFLKLGRKSLRSEEWQEVAEKVSQESKMERTDSQCRNRLDTLKKKYKKEKVRLAGAGGGTSKWVYYKKMDMLMSSPQQQAGLACGMDSGEFVFMNPRVYLNRANGLDEMRDSPGNSESSQDDDEDSDGPPKRKRMGENATKGSSFKVLAESIQKFSEIYEKIERTKRQQMVELEKMRMDFQREMEAQRRQILESARADIEKILNGDDENDASG